MIVPAPNKVPYSIPLPNNMGMVRYVMAIAVVIAHFSLFSGYDIWFPLSSFNAVGGFFALSGFLIYGSYLKHPGDIRGYLKKRARRLLPPYIGTVVLSAVLLVFMSTLSAADYFSSAGFWKYLGANLCFLNFLAPDLPGVFTGMQVEAVNVSLWTMKVEWLLYLSVPPVAWLAGKRVRRGVMIFVAIYIFSAVWRITCYMAYEKTGSMLYDILSRQFLGQMMYFYSGVLIYYFYDWLMARRLTVLAICIVLTVARPWVPLYDIILGPIVLAMLVIWFSMTGRWGTWEGKHDNVSYDMYLMHAPLIQVLVATGITATLGPRWSLAATLLLVFVAALLLNRLLTRSIANWKN